MPQLHLLAIIALAAVLSAPSGLVLAQDETVTEASTDQRFTELRARFPTTLRGSSLADNLQLASGEELFDAIALEESAHLQAVLDEYGKTTADYAAATSWLQTADDAITVLQAHRISGVDAAATLEDWVELLSMSMDRPTIDEDRISGRTVTLVRDAATPAIPGLYLFGREDVTWMIVSTDEIIVAEAIEAVDGVGAEATTTEADAGTGTDLLLQGDFLVAP